MKRKLSAAEIVAAAPKTERWIPLNQDGTVLYDRESGSTGFANVMPEGRVKFRRMYRALAKRALGARGGVEALTNAEKLKP